MVNLKARRIFARIGILLFLFVSSSESAAWAEDATETQTVELIEALKAADVSVRLSATEALAAMRPSDKAAVPALIEALGDENRNVRRAVAIALGRIGLVAVPALIEALKDADTAIRLHAAFALGQMGPRAEAAVPALIDALKDADTQVSWRAVEALAAIGPQAEAAVPAPIDELKSPNGLVRHCAPRGMPL